MDIYNKYSFSELIIHPRIQSDFYKAPVKAEYFDYSTKNSKIPLIFNGELNTIEDIDNCYEQYPGIKGIMLGRGLISNPSMISTIPNIIKIHFTISSYLLTPFSSKAFFNACSTGIIEHNRTTNCIISTMSVMLPITLSFECTKGI